MASKTKHGKRSDKRPSRTRYWSSGWLAFRKIRNLMRCGGMKLEAAIKEWESSRKRYRGADINTVQYRRLQGYER